MSINPTQITPPRVAFLDPITGAVSRQWYMFFLSLWTAIGDNEDSSNLLPDTSTAALDAGLAALRQIVNQAPDNTASYIAQLESQIQALASAPSYTPPLDNKRYGAFYDSTDQTASAINTQYAMTFSDTQYTNGVTLGSPTSRVYVDRPSIYNIQFSAQLDKTSANVGNVWIWLDVNGTAVPDTATQISLQGSSAASLAAWNFLQELNAGDYFRLMWATDDTDCFIKHDIAAPPVPAIPSVILTVTDNIK